MLGFKPKPPPVDINKLIPTTPSMAERIKMAAEAEKRLPAAANAAVGKTGKQFANPAGSSGGMVNRTMHTQPAAFTGNHAAPGNMTVGDDHSLQTQQLKRLIDETNAERHKVNLKPLPLPPQKP